MRGAVRLALIIVLATAGTAAADPLWDAELRLGYGVALGGGGEMTSTRATPLTISAIGSFLLRDDPALSAYGGLVVETLDRNSVGGLAGFKLRPGHGNVRLMAGGVAMSKPKTLWGASAGGGYCGHASPGFAMCGDVMLTSFFAGTDLAPGHTVTQIQLQLGLVFDAL
jgi:hypothetical protein